MNWFKPASRAVATLSAALVFTGCGTTQVRWDATSLRRNATAYYEDQIMDNLIRAWRGQLFVHLDLIAIDTELATSISSTASGGRDQNKEETLVGSALEFARSINRPFSVAVTPGQTQTLNLNANTVRSAPEVYRAYVQFLNLENSGQRLKDANGERVRDQEVTSLAVKDQGIADEDIACVPGTLKKGDDGRTYFIPFRFRKAFQELCFAVLQSGSTSTQPPVEKDGGPSAAGRTLPTVQDLEKRMRDQTELLQNEIRRTR
jgi:hypothetical protein